VKHEVQSPIDMLPPAIRHAAPRPGFGAPVSPAHGATPSLIQDRLRDLYLGRGLSTRQIAKEVEMDRHTITHLLHEAGVEVRPRGAGRARPTRRIHDPSDLPCLLYELYICQRLTSKQVGARLRMSERTVRDRLHEFGIPVRTRGWANREDRTVLSIDTVESMYVEDGRSAQEIARQFGTSCHVVLRMAHDHGWPVRLGGPPARNGPTEIELVNELYADPQVAAVLTRSRIPRVPAGAPIWRRFPEPIPLSRDLLHDLYLDCGLGTHHIELLTGQPAMTVAQHLRAAGIPLRLPGGRSPFLRRWRRNLSRILDAPTEPRNGKA